MILAIGGGDTLITKPVCTNVLAERGWDEDTGTYTDTGNITVWYEYSYLDATDGYRLKKDQQWEKYALDFDSGDASTVVDYTLTNALLALFDVAPSDPAGLLPEEAPDLPDAPT